MAFCMACGTHLPADARFCASCGRSTVSAPPPQAPPPYAPAGPQAATFYAPTTTVNVHAPPGKPPVTSGIAVVALLLNVLLWPGLGSIIAGRGVGWAQGFLMLFGVIFALVLIGIPFMIAAWVWGIVTGVQLIDQANRAR